MGNKCVPLDRAHPPSDHPSSGSQSQRTYSVLQRKQAVYTPKSQSSNNGQMIKKFEFGISMGIDTRRDEIQNSEALALGRENKKIISDATNNRHSVAIPKPFKSNK